MTIEKTVNFLSDTLRRLGYPECELIYEEVRRGVTRFAQDCIHQTSDVEQRWVTVRYYAQGRIGVGRTTCFDHASLAKAAKQAEAMALAQPEKEVKGAGLPPAFRGISTAGFDEATAHAQAFERAQLVRNLVDWKAPSTALLSGSLVTRHETFAVVSSEGVRVFEERTAAEINLVAQDGPTSGRSYWAGWRLSDAPLRRMLEEALYPTKMGAPQAASTSTKERVVLDYLAAAQLVGFLGYLGFGAKAYLEHRSFLNRALGQAIASNAFSLMENPQAILPRAFDYHGMPRRSVVLIDKGIACGLVTDWETARQLGQEDHGHAPEPESDDGPLPTNLVVTAGPDSLADLCAKVGEGIYIRDLHYVNIVEPLTTTITGMTRHGVFRIRGGELAEPVRDMRFQVSILEVLKALIGMGSEKQVGEGACGLVETPALASEHFLFTGAPQSC